MASPSPSTARSFRPKSAGNAAPAISDMRVTDFTLSTGMIPGITGVVTPSASRSPRNSNHTSASKKNWDSPKSASPSLSAWRRRSSVALVDA